MPKTLAERQAEYRARKGAAFSRMKASLEAILPLVEGNEKPLAVKIAKLAREGLGRKDEQ